MNENLKIVLMTLIIAAAFAIVVIYGSMVDNTGSKVRACGKIQNETLRVDCLKGIK